ncbi:MAG: hypothetical protein E7588_09665 [Ruminococcaceae bacterium]|nr:hypothetical protein [Oscillospiraceae bacterium]
MKKLLILLTVAVLFLGSCKSPGQRTEKDLDAVRQNAYTFVKSLTEKKIDYIIINADGNEDILHGNENCLPVIEAISKTEFERDANKYEPGAQAMKITLCFDKENYILTYPVYEHNYKGDYESLGCTIENTDAAVYIANLIDEIYGAHTPENVCPYALMVIDEFYYYTGQVYTMDSNEQPEMLGNVTSVVPENRMPSRDGEANIDILGAPYTMYDQKLIVKIDNEWIYFEKR